MTRVSLGFWLVPALLSATFVANSHAAEIANATPKISPIVYHGWTDAILMSNGQAEVVIVPAIGRVMQFRFAGENDGPLWENRSLDGKSPDPNSSEWGNFGGDKTWPSPQADWGKVAKRSWPPPPAFDSMPVEARVNDGAVTLVSPVDVRYGIRTFRRITLASGKPVMTISTTFEKVSGEPVKSGVWIVTQFKEPVLACAHLPLESKFQEDFNKQSQSLPIDFEVKDRILGLRRDPKSSHKIGTDGGALLWIGEKSMVRIDSPRLAGKEYPDQSSSSEIYTNPDPLPYVELEMLGPLSTLRVGDRIEGSSTYTLMRRTNSDPKSDAQIAFSH